jgi:hypothetical protein
MLNLSRLLVNPNEKKAVIIHLAVNKLLKNFSRLKKPHTKYRRCKCIRRLEDTARRGAKSQSQKEESITQSRKVTASQRRKHLAKNAKIYNLNKANQCGCFD